MLVVGFGMPGCGKSSVIAELGKSLGVRTFLEPEEGEWPTAVHQREMVGYVTAIHWFRSIRVPQLYEAKSLSEAGEIVLVDSYYDKLWASYIGKPGMEWLLPPSDQYFNNLRDLATLDRSVLPDADLLIFFEVEEADYLRMLAARNRSLDKSSDLADRFATQQYFRIAAEEYVSARAGQTKYVVHKNTFASPVKSAATLLEVLQPQMPNP
jgi:deoxyadenosine/deoxycytidine kinase